MIKVSTTGMAVSLKTDLRFPISGQWGHGDRIIQLPLKVTCKNLMVPDPTVVNLTFSMSEEVSKVYQLGIRLEHKLSFPGNRS